MFATGKSPCGEYVVMKYQSQFLKQIQVYHLSCFCLARYARLYCSLYQRYGLGFTHNFVIQLFG